MIERKLGNATIITKIWLLHVLKSFTLMFHRVYNLEIVTRAMKESYKLPSCKRTPQKDLGCIFLLLLKSILLLQHTRFQHIFSRCYPKFKFLTEAHLWKWCFLLKCCTIRNESLNYFIPGGTLSVSKPFISQTFHAETSKEIK